MKQQQLVEGITVEVCKASNGVMVRPTYNYSKDNSFASTDVMVFDSVEPFLKWMKEFFPEAA